MQTSRLDFRGLGCIAVPCGAAALIVLLCERYAPGLTSVWVFACTVVLAQLAWLVWRPPPLRSRAVTPYAPPPSQALFGCIGAAVVGALGILPGVLLGALVERWALGAPPIGVWRPYAYGVWPLVIAVAAPCLPLALHVVGFVALWTLTRAESRLRGLALIALAAGIATLGGSTLLSESIERLDDASAFSERKTRWLVHEHAFVGRTRAELEALLGPLPPSPRDPAYRGRALGQERGEAFSDARIVHFLEFAFDAHDVCTQALWSRWDDARPTLYAGGYVLR